MFSRDGFKKALSAVLAVSVFTGCNMKVGEEPPPPTTQSFSGTQCISSVMPHLTDFIEGKGNEQGINATWDCFSVAMDKFRKYVRGRASDRYTSQELADFLQNNFFDPNAAKKEITPALQAEIMKIKQIFLGGSTQYLTMRELEQAPQLFQTFKRLAIKLNPYMKIYVLEWTPSNGSRVDEDSRFFEQSNEVIQSVVKDLSVIIQANKSNYKLADFSVFLKELSGLYNENWSFVEKLDKFMPVVQKIKKSISGGNETTVLENEWRSFLLLGARGYIQFLRYNYFISSAPQSGTSIRLGYVARSLEDLLSVFQDLVSEKPSGIVSREEIYDLLLTVSKAWPDFKVSDKLVVEVMRLKQLFIGGTDVAFTVSDFSNAKLKVGKLKSIVERFLPYYSVYGQDWDKEYYSDQDAQKYFSQAQVSLEASAQELGAILENSYDLKNLQSLISEISRLYADDSVEKFNGKVWDDNFKKYLPLIIDVKNTVYAQTGSVIIKNQWPSILRHASRIYTNYLYQKYFFGDQETINTLRGMTILDNVATLWIGLAKDLVTQNPNGYFTKSDLNRIGQKLVTIELLPKSITADVMTTLVDTVLNRVLVLPEKRLNGYVPNAFGFTSLEIIRFEVKSWIDTEKYLFSIFPNQRVSYSPQIMLQTLSSAAARPGISESLKVGLSELSLAVQSNRSMTVNKDGYVQISEVKDYPYDRSSVSQLNMNRVLTRLLIRSYGSDLKKILNYEGIVLADAQKAYADLKPVAVSFGLIDKSNMTFADSRFREANMFVPHANGDQVLSFQEGVDLVGMIWSGINIHSTLKDQLVAKGTANAVTTSCLPKNVEITSDTLVSVDCVMKTYYRVVPSLMSGMPNYVKYMSSISESEWNGYFMNVLKSAGYVPNDQKLAKMGDVQLVPHVIQYIEMIFAKYDADNDGILRVPEALEAFPVFRSIIKQFADGQVKDKNLDAIFMYILHKGRPPESIWEKLYYKSWEGKPEYWTVSESRSKLAQILGYIADQLSKPAVKQDPKKIVMPDMSDLHGGG